MAVLPVGSFFSPRLSCDNRFIVGITTSPFTLPSRNNPLNNSHRFTLIITWHRLSVCKQRESDNRHPMDWTKLEQCLYFKTFPFNYWLFSLAFLKAYSQRANQACRTIGLHHILCKKGVFNKSKDWILSLKSFYLNNNHLILRSELNFYNISLYVVKYHYHCHPSWAAYDMVLIIVLSLENLNSNLNQLNKLAWCQSHSMSLYRC